MKARLLLLPAVIVFSAHASGADSGRVAAHFKDFNAMSLKDGRPDRWTTWSPRSEISPKFAVEPGVSADSEKRGSGSLMIESRNPAQFGAWRTTIDGIRGGHTYRFTALYRAEHIKNEQRSVSVRLDWLDESGKNARPSDYVLNPKPTHGWTRLNHVTQAPDSAKSVRVELGLLWADKGRVYFDDIKLEEESAPSNRVIRAATLFLKPSDTKSPEESVDAFIRLIENRKLKDEKLDILCLPEGITIVGNWKPYVELAESIPGPTTARLSKVARNLGCYLVAGIYERVGSVVYNTSVLIGRRGEIVGKYRKTHLPREEVEGGLTPGDSYPVFETDFGKVGMMICWDVQFPEAARGLAAKGAEVILLPIAGGSEVLARARAIENHVFLLSSSYDMKTFIVAPDGEVLAEASPANRVVIAELHLDRKIIQPWVGDMKPRTWKERRPDIPID